MQFCSPDVENEPALSTNEENHFEEMILLIEKYEKRHLL